MVAKVPKQLEALLYFGLRSWKTEQDRDSDSGLVVAMRPLRSWVALVVRDSALSS